MASNIPTKKKNKKEKERGRILEKYILFVKNEYYHFIKRIISFIVYKFMIEVRNKCVATDPYIDLVEVSLWSHISMMSQEDN